MRSTRFLEVMFVVYFVEVGLLLVVVPWTIYWDRNYFVELLPALEPVLTSHVVRGGVTGVGLLSAGAALVDIVAAGQRLLAHARAPRASRSVLADAARRT